MTTYVIRDDRLVEKTKAAPKNLPGIVSDLAPYRSPICDASGAHPVIDGRRAQREDLKRHNCRLVEPSETLRANGGTFRPYS